ncbi:MAG TPA: hypothetical protein VMK16_00300, partial [Acidimicrobiales bacterium]|nr:hypothetical protein [Acidimicrobiales bacterium]
MTELGYGRGKAMRAARRVIVLVGILAMALFAPITWSQAGAQTEGGDDPPPVAMTFVKIVCSDFGSIPKNFDTGDGLSARPDGTELGPPIDDRPVSA